jgi:hypothetical protein
MGHCSTWLPAPLAARDAHAVEASSNEAQPGDRWAYRARSVDDLDEVEVVRFGSKRPLRVLVRFIDTKHEGREDWVSPARLKVPWANRLAFLEHERRWDAVREPSPWDRYDPALNAAQDVFDFLRSWQFAEPGYNRDDGLLKITGLDGLLADLKLERAAVADHPLAFQEDGQLIVPWPVTELIARRAAERYAAELLPIIDAKDHEAEQHNRWGYNYSNGHMPAEICAETDAKFKPARDLLREWCGQPARERYDELMALRAEVLRLGLLVERAVTALRDAGVSKVADQIERDLGVPVTTVHAEQERRERDQSRYGR